MKVPSEEFLALPAHLDLPPLDGGFDGRIQVIVGGTPDGNVRVLGRFEGGRITGWGLESDRESELVLTIRHPDLLALLAGEADLNALFISGALKTEGPTGPLLDLIVALRSDAGRAMLADLNAAAS